VATSLLGKFLGIMSGLSLGTRVSNLKSVSLTVLELLAFNSHDRPLRAHTHTHTHTDKHIHTSNERIISAIHFVHLVEIIMMYAELILVAAVRVRVNFGRHATSHLGDYLFNFVSPEMSYDN